jgi:hypothetical protein
MRKILLALVPACSYAPHSFENLGTPFPGQRFTTECLDVSVARTSDKLATGPVIEYSFGNRCTHAVTVDLASVRVTGDGLRMRAFDPKHELRPMQIDAFWQGSEKIEYREQATSLCIEVSHIQADAPTAERVVCVDAWSDS